MTQPLILVTGATGTVGRELVQQLADAGQRVRAMVHDPAKNSMVPHTVETVVADFVRLADLAAAFANVDKVFILAPPGPNMDVLEANALAAARNAGVKQIVYLSNFGAGTFDSMIWRQHGANERQLRELGLPWTVLRPARFMTSTPFPWSWNRRNGVISEAIGDHRMTLIDPRDIAAVAVKVLTTPGHDGQIYELTAAEALSGAEIVSKIAKATGKSMTFAAITADAARQAVLDAGVPYFIADTVECYARTVREGRWYVTSTVAALLGRAPRSYDEWLADNAAMYA